MSLITPRQTKKPCVQEGESIVMPVNIPHSVKALTKMKMLLVLVK